VPAVAHVRLTWVTRLFCPASRRESLPHATIWSFYLYLAGEPQKSQIAGGRDFNRRALIILWSRRREIYSSAVAAFPPPTPSFRHSRAGTGESERGQRAYFLRLTRTTISIVMIRTNIPIIPQAKGERENGFSCTVTLKLNSLTSPVRFTDCSPSKFL